MGHLRKHGYPVRTEDLPNLAPIKQKHRVPPSLEGCHTALVDGYVIEGHVPADLIDRLLKERPAVIGLAVPGMPGGSPGMDNAPRVIYQVLTFDASARTTVFATR